MHLRQSGSAPMFGEALDRLAGVPGVVGALVMGRDGLPVAARIEDREAGESWAAVAAVLGNLAGQLLDAAERDEMTAAVFTAAQHQFVVLPVGVGYLLAIAQPGADGAALCERARAVADEVNSAAAALTGHGE